MKSGQTDASVFFFCPYLFNQSHKLRCTSVVGDNNAQIALCSLKLTNHNLSCDERRWCNVWKQKQCECVSRWNNKDLLAFSSSSSSQGPGWYLWGIVLLWNLSEWESETSGFPLWEETIWSCEAVKEKQVAVTVDGQKLPSKRKTSCIGVECVRCCFHCLYQRLTW